jgi:hypothetical protein
VARGQVRETVGRAGDFERGEYSLGWLEVSVADE